MIALIDEQINEITHYKPFEDSKEEFLHAIYKLLPVIRKEPNCISYEVFVAQDGNVVTIGKWQKTGYNLHTNMQYMEVFRRKVLPVYCERFESERYNEVEAPLSATSLF